MARTFIRQDTQIRQSDVFTDNLAAGVTLQSGAANVEDDLNSLRSRVHDLLNVQASNWYAALNVPSYLDPGAARGVNNLNTDLHAVERKRVLVANFIDITVAVPALQNWVVLAAPELPTTPGDVAAIGSVTTLGSVAAYVASFGAHSLALVTGGAAISPKNLCDVYDNTTGQAILSGGRQVYALFQTESNVDGSTMSGTTPDRAQLSFVRINATDTALEAVPVADIAGKSIDYTNILRKGLTDLTEQDFLRGTTAQVPTGTSVTRQVAYDGQGTAPVELTTNATLDLNAAGEFWKIRDLVNADLFTITEGSTGGTTTLQVGTDVDTLDVNAVVNDFNTGIRAATGSQRIDIGVTAGVIESKASNDLRLLGAVKLKLDDSYQPGSSWVATDGISLADASAEWTSFKASYGEVSLLSAIVTAKNSNTRGAKVYAVLTANVNAGVDVGGVSGGANLDAQLPNMSGGNFLTGYDVFLNGNLLRPGANVGAGHDYYPGTSLPNGQLMFAFKLKFTGTSPDVLCVIPYA